MGIQRQIMPILKLAPIERNRSLLEKTFGSYGINIRPLCGGFITLPDEHEFQLWVDTL
jgi:hypothetical protein